MSKLSITQRLTAAEPVISIEFFPPKSDDAAGQLLETAQRLSAFKPEFASITYGAGGSTRSRTLKYARKLHQDFGYNVMPHLTCVGHSKQELTQIIGEFKAAGLSQIMALRGDPPKGANDFSAHPDGLCYANELVELIQEVYPECVLGVAGYPEMHPEANSASCDLENLKRKVDAGADFCDHPTFLRQPTVFQFCRQLPQAGHHQPHPAWLNVDYLAQASDSLLQNVRHYHSSRTRRATARSGPRLCGGGSGRHRMDLPASTRTT